MKWDEDIDASGLLCPLPVLKARKRLSGMAEGAVLRIRTTDPAARIDIPHFCVEAGHALVSDQPDGEARVFLIRRAHKTPKPA